MIHGIGDERLQIADRAGSVESDAEIHIHVVHIYGRVRGDLIASQLFSVVKLWPVLVRRQDTRDVLEIRELVVRLEHVFVDLLYG